MAYCSKCGTQLLDGQNVCPNCGEPVGGSGAPNVDPVQGTVQAGDDDVKNNKVYAILAYLGILVLIPIFAAPNSQFAKFHANQGLILFIGAIVASFVGMIPFVGWIASLVCSIAIFVFAIMGIINAAKGEMVEVPIIGGIQLLK